ncbi:hypothetical protein ACWEPM_25715 [Streptomyces sp. NPDC004244]
MHTDPADDDGAGTTDYDTSEMLRQVFLRALTVPPPQGKDPVPHV